MRYQHAITNRLGNRQSNQDRCLIRHGKEAVLLVVADGMGGHARGDLAAQTAVDTFSRLFRQHKGRFQDPHDFLRNAMEQAHDRVTRVGLAQHPPIEPRTTCVACLVQGQQAWWAHVGDSRLYLLREGRVVLRTLDHTPVEELLQSGAITEAEALKHPRRNSVSQCLGGTMTQPEISLGGLPQLQEKDGLLLCSDGLWSALEKEVLGRVQQEDDLHQALEQLAEKAEHASYPYSDNISAVAMRWLGHEEAEAGEGKAVFATDDRPKEGAAKETDTDQAAVDQKKGDPGSVDAAIAQIERAIELYGDEMTKGRK